MLEPKRPASINTRVPNVKATPETKLPSRGAVGNGASASVIARVVVDGSVILRFDNGVVRLFEALRDLRLSRTRLEFRL